MLETFSVRAVELIDNAKHLCKIENESKKEYIVSTFYLLVSMFTANDTICHFLLNEQNIKIDDIYKSFENISDQELPAKVFSKEFEELVIKSAILANELKSEYVYDEHLFYELLNNKNLTATKVLIDLGLDIEQMMQDIKDIFNFNAEPIYLIEKKDAKPLNYLINLSTLPDIHSYVLREDYLDQLIYILNKKQKNNPLLIGQAGVGKTALVTALAKMIDQDIYELDLGEMIAGTKYRGEMEEKLTQAIDYIYEHNAILFIDEVHNIVGAGSNDGSLDAANILKPYLSRGKVKVIAATTLDEYYKYIEKDKALVRRFRTVFINEPTKEETLTILKGIKQDYIKYYNYNIQDDLLEYIVNLTDSYVPLKTFPDKAIDVLDETLSKFQNNKKDIKQIVKEVINSYTGLVIPSEEELSSFHLHYDELKKLYLRKLYPVNVTNNLGVVGVNKTFNINLLLSDLNKVFGIKKENYLEIDLADYTLSETITNLIGSSKGYVGYEQGGLIYNHLLKFPFSVIYIKNFDLGIPFIKQHIKSLFKKKKVVDAHSRTIYLNNTLFIIETNEAKSTIGFTQSTMKENFEYDLFINSKVDETNELLNNLLKKGIIVEGFKTLSLNEQINIYYQVITKPIGKYKINKDKELTI